MGKMDYVKKEYDKTRTMPGNWFLSSYRYKFNITQMKPFLDALKDKKIIGLQCRGCNTVSFPPKYVCGKCLVRPDKWVPLRETGIVASYTVAFIKDEQTGITNELLVITVKQDGCDTTYGVELNPNIKFKEVYVGMPVKVKWRDDTKGGLDDIEYYDKVDDITEKMDLLEQEED